MATGQRVPRQTQIDPWLIGEDWAYCVLIKLDPVFERSRFSAVGPRLQPPRLPPLDGQPITACPDDCLLGAMMKYLARFYPITDPLRVSGTAHQLGAGILFRGVFLPLSEDRAHIDGILGAANFRELHRGEEKELKTRLEVGVLAVQKGQVWDIFHPTWGGWTRAVVTAIDGERAILRRQGQAGQSTSCARADMLQRSERYRFIAHR